MVKLGQHHGCWCPVTWGTRTSAVTKILRYPHHPMITHTSDSHQIPSQNETKSRLQILKNCQKFKFFIFAKKTLHVTHLLKLLDKMCKYEMDQRSIVEDTERTPFCPQTDILEKTQIHVYSDENRWFFCLLRIIQESGVYQLGVLHGLGDSSVPSTTETHRGTRWN